MYAVSSLLTRAVLRWDRIHLVKNIWEMGHEADGAVFGKGGGSGLFGEHGYKSGDVRSGM